MSFFTSGEVDIKNIDRAKLPEGIYRVRLVDFADHLGAFTGSRTQIDFIVLAGPVAVGSRKGHIVGHNYDAPWKSAKARGEIATALAAFMGKSREGARDITPQVFLDNSRTVKYVAGGKEVGDVSRDASALGLVQARAEAILVVHPYMDKKTGKRKINDKTGQPSVIYEFQPLSAGLEPTATSAVADESDDFDAPPPAVEATGVDALEAARADGWKENPANPVWFFKKGSSAQHKEAALRAMYGG
jgi:hypothetical protein